MKKSGKESAFILQDNLWNVMWKLSWPSLISMMLVGINSFIDAIFIGQFLGNVPLAGVSLAVPLTFISLGIAQLIGNGAAAVLSIAIGAKDTDTQEKVWGNMQLMNIFFGFLATIGLYLLARPMIRIMGGTNELLELGTEFYKTYALCNLFIFFSMTGGALIRAEGKMKEALLLAGMILLINVGLNPVYIKVLGLGVKGSALATGTAHFFGAIAVWSYYGTGHASFNINMRKYRLEKSVLKRIAAIGLPSFIVQFMNVVQGWIVFNTLSRFGQENDIAFYGAVSRILMLCLMPGLALMRAAQPALGMNFGAKNFHRVTKGYQVFVLSGLILLVGITLPMVAFPGTILSSMLPHTLFSHGEIIDFRVLISSNILIPVILVGITLFQSVNNPKIAGILALGNQLLLFIPAVLIFAHIWGVDGIYYSQASVSIFSTLAVILFVGFEFKKLKAKNANEEMIPQAVVAD